jgi:hypothetical protein
VKTDRQTDRHKRERGNEEYFRDAKVLPRNFALQAGNEYDRIIIKEKQELNKRF